jgi:hypothetical protein
VRDTAALGDVAVRSVYWRSDCSLTAEQVMELCEERVMKSRER